MRSVLFTNSGIIPIESFMYHGVNAKPVSKSPFGFFGTGLKLAIATLVREGIKVRLFRGKTEYEFYVKDGDFRGKNFGFVMMKKRTGLLSKWTYEKLPFTTELGKTWKLWQAYRELESNTRDENGYSTIVNDDEYMFEVTSDSTNIIVEGEAFLEAYEKSAVFLPKEREVRGRNDELEVLNVGSKHLYYRDVRVSDLNKPTLYTYNFHTMMDLTEDRTLKYSYMADYYIKKFLMCDCEDEQMIRSILSKDNEEKIYEAGLSFDHSTDFVPSETWKRAVSYYEVGSVPYNIRAGGWYGSYYTSPPNPTLKLELNKSDTRLMNKVLSALAADDPLELTEDERNHLNDIQKTLQSEIDDKMSDLNTESQYNSVEEEAFLERTEKEFFTTPEPELVEEPDPIGIPDPYIDLDEEIPF